MVDQDAPPLSDPKDTDSLVPDAETPRGSRTELPGQKLPGQKLPGQKKLTMWSQVTGSDGFLAWVMWPAAILFALLTFGTVTALLSGVKDHEVLVASLYTGGCILALLTSSAALVHSIAWVPLFSLTASLSGTIVFFLEADLRLEENRGSALLIITIPLMVGVVSFGAFLRARRRRRALLAKVPSAQVHSTASNPQHS